MIPFWKMMVMAALAALAVFFWSLVLSEIFLIAMIYFKSKP